MYPCPDMNVGWVAALVCLKCLCMSGITYTKRQPSSNRFKVRKFTNHLISLHFSWFLSLTTICIWNALATSAPYSPGLNKIASRRCLTCFCLSLVCAAYCWRNVKIWGKVWFINKFLNFLRKLLTLRRPVA